MWLKSLALLATFLIPVEISLAQTQSFGTPISGLPPAGALTGVEPIPVVQGGVTKRTTPAAIATYIGGSSVTSLTNSDGTLTIAPSVGPVVASLNLTHPNTWVGVQTFPNSSITNAELVNPSLTINSTTCTLGSSCAPKTTPLPATCTIASAATVDLGTCPNGAIVTITGTTTMTNFGSSASAGSQYIIQSVSNPSITGGANMVLPGSFGSLGMTANSILMAYAPVAGTWYVSEPVYSSALGLTPGGVINTTGTITSSSAISGQRLFLNGVNANCSPVGFNEPVSNSMAFCTNTAEAGRIDGTQHWLLGYTADQGGGQKLQVSGSGYVSGILDVGDAPIVSVAGQTILNSFMGTNTGSGLNLLIQKSFNSTAAPSMALAKSRGTIASPTTIVTGDAIGNVVGDAFDGTNFVPSAQLNFISEGTVSTGIVPSVILFRTTNSSGTLLEAMRINSSQVLSISSGLANSLTLAGSATNPTIGTNNGNLALSPATSRAVLNGFAAIGPELFVTTIDAGADLKTWGIGNTQNSSTSFSLRAINDSISAVTTAYTITRGTTYNVASHIWYTSTTAGTAVQGMQLNTNNLTVGNGTYSSFQAVSPGANLWVNLLQVSGAVSGGSPGINAAGTDTNIGLNISTKGNSGINFLTELYGKIQFAILDNASGADYITVMSGSGAAVLSTNAGNLSLNSAGGSTTLADGGVTLPSIPSSASALDAVCWNATGGVLTHNAAGALCSASLEELKDKLGAITAGDADVDLMALHPFWGKFKDSVTTISDHRVQPFFGAHQVEGVDPRLVEYDVDGNLRSVRYANLTALLTVAYQTQSVRLQELEARVKTLEAGH